MDCTASISGPGGKAADLWPVRVHGSKTADELRLELQDATGKALGLVISKKIQKFEKMCVLLVYSATPRLEGQLCACEWTLREEGMQASKHALARLETPGSTWACLPTKTPLTLTSGAPVYSWALLQPTGSWRGGYRAFLADNKGAFALGKRDEAYTGTAPTFFARGTTLHLKRGVRGCLVLQHHKAAHHSVEQETDEWRLEVAPGADPLLMLAFTLLYEKQELLEHFVPEMRQ